MVFIDDSALEQRQALGGYRIIAAGRRAGRCLIPIAAVATGPAGVPVELPTKSASAVISAVRCRVAALGGYCRPDTVTRLLLASRRVDVSQIKGADRRDLDDRLLAGSEIPKLEDAEPHPGLGFSRRIRPRHVP